MADGYRHLSIQRPEPSPGKHVAVLIESASSLISISRQKAVDKIISNLLYCGVVLEGEETMYRSVIQQYDDSKLLDVLEYSEELKIQPRKN